MQSMLFAESAILLCLHSIRVSLLVFRPVVITLLAFRASESDFHAGADSHANYLHFLFDQEMTGKYKPVSKHAHII